MQVDIWEDLRDLATGRVGIQLRKKCGLITIACGDAAKQSPGFLFVETK